MSRRPSHPTGPVLLIANNFPPVRGGSASVYANLARCAAGRVSVLAPQINYADGLPIIGWREHDRQMPYRVLRIPLLRTTIGRRSGARRVFFLLWDAAIRLRLSLTLARLVLFDGVRTICIGELLASGWIIHLFRHIGRVRTVVYVHGEEITTQNASDPSNQTGRRALQDSDAIIVVSRFTLGAVEALLAGAAPTPHPHSGRHSGPGKIQLIENGVDTARFSPAPKPPALLALHDLAGRFVFVSVCRLVQKKGIDNAIRAFATVARQHPEARYLVVGTGPFEDALKALAVAEGVADRVIFTGQVAEDELVEHYRLGDVFIMPNRRMPDGDTEGFGLVFLEANGCGLPVIAGRDGGSTDAVKDGFNGLVVDGHAVPEIAAAMLRLQDDAALRTRLQQGARVAARQAGWDEKTRVFLQICATPQPA